MNVSDYYRSLSLELTALKDRVRNFIEGGHWQTDGEWKETVLRSILRRHLPDNIGVGRGFIVNPVERSSQIDVLLYDTSKPILYRDGDLVFVTSDAVRGIIEVKSKIYRNKFEEVSGKLADNAALVFRNTDEHDRVDNLFVGLFAYESDMNKDHAHTVLDGLQRISHRSSKRVVNHLAFGASLFVRFWSSSPDGLDDYNKWHAYEVEDRAFGYFINNVVNVFASKSVSLNHYAWFPIEGKESNRLAVMPLNDV